MQHLPYLRAIMALVSLPLGVTFAFFNALQSRPAVSTTSVLYVYLLPKSIIPSAQHDREGSLFAQGVTTPHFRPFPSGVTESRSHGTPLTWPLFLFEKDEVGWSGGMNMNWISRDIKLCAQEVKLCAQKMVPRGSRSLASIPVGCSDETHHG